MVSRFRYLIVLCVVAFGVAGVVPNVYGQQQCSPDNPDILCYDLGTLGGSSRAYSINESGQVVGWSDTGVPGESRAFIWTETDGMQDLGVLGADCSGANYINNAGQVGGTSAVAWGEVHATLWILPPPTPEEQIEEIIEDVEELVASGSLSKGLGNSLISKLEAVKTDKPKQATNVLNAFKNHVEALIRTGRLTVEEGQALIDAADAIIEQLNQ